MRILKNTLAVLAMVAVIAGAGALQFLTDPTKPEEDPTAVVVPMEKDAYNGCGLEGGQGLSPVKLAEIDGKVCFEDRVFRRFTYKKEDLNRFVRAMKGLKNMQPELDFYVMPVPGRVLTEAGYDQDRENYERFITDMEKSLGNTAALLDPWPVLQEHGDEYVFYRTEDGWSARGAYYGSVMLCEALGVEPFELSDYDEYMYNESRGSLARNAKEDYEAVYGKNSETAEKLRDITADRFYFYKLPGAADLEELYDDDTGRMTVQPTISLSRGGTKQYIGGSYLHALLRGDGKSEAVKDETLLMICDGSGNPMAAFMANYYKNVYVVSMQDDEGFLDRLNVLVDRFDIHTVAVVQKALYMGDKTDGRAIRGLMD